MRIKIFNGKVITPYKVIPNGHVLVEGTTIVGVGEGNPETPDYTEMDAAGKMIAPGFIDIHIHGGGGDDFMDGDADAFLRIAEVHAKHGTTGMMPTTLSSSPEELEATLSAYDKAQVKNERGAQFLGMHIEGPYFAMNQRGAQHPKYIRDPDPTEYESILARYSNIRRWSAAPELKGAIAFGRYLRSRGVIASVAHTDAIYEEVQEAFENGYSLATHLYSGMSMVTRRNAFRYAGAVEAAFLIDEMDVEIIADGVHLPAPLLKLVYKIKGPDRIALITDAMRAAGLPPGDSVLGHKDHGLKVIVEDGVAKLPDRTAFAGSVATADRLVRTMVNLAGIPLADAVRMITATPARILGVGDRKGSLSIGKDADVLIFDEAIQMAMTMVAGTVVYRK